MHPLNKVNEIREKKQTKSVIGRLVVMVIRRFIDSNEFRYEGDELTV